MMRVIRVDSSVVQKYILSLHYAKRMPSVMYAFVLADEKKTIGVITYGKPASPWLCVGVCGPEHSASVIELNRLVIMGDAPNLASILISGSLRQLPSGLCVVSYADTAMGHVGYVYQATNFIYTGITKERTDMASSSGHSRHNDGDRSNRVHRSAKHRYVFFTGKRNPLRPLLRYPVEPYPKGETRRYENEFTEPLFG